MAGLGSEPRGMFERRNALQKQKYPELDLATPKMVSQVDALRVGENRLPSLLTRETTKLAADIVRSKPPPLAPEPADEGGGGGWFSGIAGGIGDVAGGIGDVAGDVAGSFVSPTTERVAQGLGGAAQSLGGMGKDAISDLFSDEGFLGGETLGEVRARRALEAAELDLVMGEEIGYQEWEAQKQRTIDDTPTVPWFLGGDGKLTQAQQREANDAYGEMYWKVLGKGLIAAESFSLASLIPKAQPLEFLGPAAAPVANVQNFVAEEALRPSNWAFAWLKAGNVGVKGAKKSPALLRLARSLVESLSTSPSYVKRATVEVGATAAARGASEGVGELTEGAPWWVGGAAQLAAGVATFGTAGWAANRHQVQAGVVGAKAALDDITKAADSAGVNNPGITEVTDAARVEVSNIEEALIPQVRAVNDPVVPSASSIDSDLDRALYRDKGPQGVVPPPSSSTEMVGELGASLRAGVDDVPIGAGGIQPGAPGRAGVVGEGVQAVPPTPRIADPKLPDGLSRSTPRYSSSELEFDSDLDRALYIIGKSGKQSKSHPKFVTWVMDNKGLSKREVEELATTRHAELLGFFKGFPAGETIVVPQGAGRVGAVVDEVLPVPRPGAVVDEVLPVPRPGAGARAADPRQFGQPPPPGSQIATGGTVGTGGVPPAGTVGTGGVPPAGASGGTGGVAPASDPYWKSSPGFGYRLSQGFGKTITGTGLVGGGILGDEYLVPEDATPGQRALIIAASALAGAAGLAPPRALLRHLGKTVTGQNAKETARYVREEAAGVDLSGRLTPSEGGAGAKTGVLSRLNRKDLMGIVRLFEGALQKRGLEVTRGLNVGNRLLKKANIGKPTKGSRVVERSPEMEQLFKALHGEAEVPEDLRRVYNELALQRDAEQAISSEYGHGFTPIKEDYFPRFWREIDIDEKTARNLKEAFNPLDQTQKFSHPDFMRSRADITFTDLLEHVFTRPDGTRYMVEPKSWNPFEMMALREIDGARYRELDVFLENLKAKGQAVDTTGTGIPEGWKIPRAGVGFEGTKGVIDPGKPGFLPAYAVPKKIAEVLEELIEVTDPVEGVAGFVLNQGQKAKRAKLLFSLFQHADFATRSTFASFGGALDHMLAGRWDKGVGTLAKIPFDIRSIMAASLSPRARRGLLDELLSNKSLYKEREGITMGGIVEAGMNVGGDLSVMRRDVGQMINDAANTGWSLTRPVKRNIARLLAANERGLFDGVYPQTQILMLKNHILPRLMRANPPGVPGSMSDAQIMAAAADEVNKMISSLRVSQNLVKSPFMRNITRAMIFSTDEAQSLLRQAGSALTGPNKKLWAEYYLGAYAALAVTANATNLASTWMMDGEAKPLTWEQYFPFEKADTPIGFQYKKGFMSPRVPIRGEDGRLVDVDPVGQLDTAFKVLTDPQQAIANRVNVLPSAVASQLQGRDFMGRPLGGAAKRGAQALSDMYEPIGLGGVREQLFPLNDPEPIGTAASLVELGTGTNLNAETPREIAARGGYETVTGVTQFEVIPHQVWKMVIDEAPGMGLEGFKTQSEWHRATAAEVYDQALIDYRGESEGLIQLLSEQAMRRHPVYQIFVNARTGLRDVWVASNPEIAIELMDSEAKKMQDSGLEWWEKMLLWQPTERQRNMMMAWQASQASPAGVR